jgi:hypothetical protein
MALDAQYIPCPILQYVFIDKDTGLPMVNGYAVFYRDNSREDYKDVYILTGSPPNYTYTNIGHEVPLNAAGAFSYGGQDVLVYLKPYDDEGNLDLYYIKVFNQNDTNQITREAIPNLTSGDTPVADGAFANYIPNGQFLSRINVQDDGYISQAITDIAYGAWTFERPESSNAVDRVTFTRFNSYSTNPPANPRYAVNVANTGGGSGNESKDLRVKFANVNRFSSTTQNYTFAFSGKSNASTFDVELVIIKNYGTGGSAATETSVQTFTITGSYQQFSSSFVFGNNADKTIGTLDDDYIQIALRLPIGVIFDGLFTDFGLFVGEFADPGYPEKTNRQMDSQFLGGSFAIPDPDGFDLYLPVILSQTGLVYDHSVIATVVSKIDNTLNVGELWLNGDAYLTSEYSDDGIPYARLQGKLWDEDTQTPIYGTGDDYMTAYLPGNTSQTNSFLLVNNALGAATVATDGLAPTGFNFKTVYTGVGSASYGINAWIVASGTGKFWVQGQAVGSVTAPGAGTSGFSVGSDYELLGTTQTPQEFDVLVVTAASLATGAAGKYWTFDSTTTAYYVWYKVTTETDPSVGGRTGIEVNITAGDDITAVAEKTVAALMNFQCSAITTVAASAMTAGSYFTANTPSEGFYIWCSIDGAGTDPNVINRTGIEVALLSDDDSTEVASKFQSAINMYSYKIPDFREQFVRGTNMSRDTIGLDGSIAYRFSRSNFKFGGDNVGSEELSFLRMHTHTNTATETFYSVNPSSGSNWPRYDSHELSSPLNFPPTVTIDNSGQSESRPANVYVNYAVKY